MSDDYFIDCAEFTSIQKGKLLPKITIPDIKFYEIENL